MTTEIFEHDIPELQSVYGKHPDDGRNAFNTIVRTERPDLGAFHVSNIAFPDIHLMDIRWNVPGELIIHESDPSQTVDLNFVLQGGIKGMYKKLRVDLELQAGTSNLKYTPTARSSHYAARQNVNMFAIALEKSYFQDMIGCDNPWAENIQRKLENGEDFFGSRQFQTMTPRMHALIDCIRNMQPAPMTRIMTQSLVLDLIAQQVEQLSFFNHERTGHHAISAADVDKLHNAKKYIERHFLDDVTLTVVCREVMLNEFKLKKGFKNLFQTSVIQYVRHLRMEFAQNLLRNNRLTIEEVSSKLGYRYPNHFSVAYKKHFGVSPSRESI